jgi:hypothetical protein
MGKGLIANTFRLFLVFSIIALFSGCGGGGGGSGSTGTGENTSGIGKDTGDGIDLGTPAGSSYERKTTYSYSYPSTTTIQLYDVTIKAADNLTTTIISYSGPGPDNTWYTSDDIIGNYSRMSYDSQKHYRGTVEYGGPGKDNKWFTGDDFVIFMAKYIGKNGDDERVAYYFDPGQDMQWNTGDDQIQYYFDVHYTASGVMDLTKRYESGSDKTFFTADDVQISWDTGTFNAGNNLLREVYSNNGQGPDGAWFTADDPDLGYDDYSYDASGKLLSRKRYDTRTYLNSSYVMGYGPDNTWFTSDDVPDECYTYEYDAKGLKTNEFSWSTGSDNRWNTADDIKAYSRGYHYDQNGSLYEEVEYENAGTDGKWDTHDDVLDEKIEYFSQLTIPPGNGPADTTPPVITASNPVGNAIGVSVNTTSISVVLSEDCIFYKAMVSINGISALTLGTSGGYGIGWGKYMSIDLKSLLPLSPSTIYTLTITGLMDRVGNVMPTRTISFTTGVADTTLPSIYSSLPASGASSVSRTLTTVEINFSEPIAFDSSMLEIFPTIPGMNSTRISYSSSSASGSVKINLTGLTLAANQGYEFDFTGVKDLSGNVMPPDSIWFTTGN